MFNTKAVLIDAFVERLQRAYRIMQGQLEPDYLDIITWVGRMAAAWRSNVSRTVTPRTIISNTQRW